MPVPSRMDVNAAIEHIIARSDVKASALVIIQFVRATMIRGVATICVKTADQKKGGSFTGYTNETGTVQIQDKPTKQQTETTLFGKQGVERVGYYKIWLAGDGLIQFWHFWKADVATAGPNNPLTTKFSIRFNPKTSELIYVSENQRIEAFRLGPFVVFKWLSDSIMGNPPRFESPVEFEINL